MAGHMQSSLFLFPLFSLPDMSKASAASQMNALHRAARDGYTQRTVALLESGSFDINEGAPGGLTPLMISSQNGLSSIVRILLDKGADISLLSSDGFSAFLVSAYRGHVSVMKLLFAAGASLGERTPTGHTALHLSANNGHLKVTKALVKLGADLEATNAQGFTPLHMASQKGRLDVVEQLLECGADPQALGSNASTPLHLAVQKKRSQVVATLVRAGTHLEATNAQGVTPLYMAAHFGHLDIVETLVDSGAKCDTILPTTGETPLFSAASAGHLGVVKVLLRAKANPSLTRTVPCSGVALVPLDAAASFGHAGVVSELMKKVGIEGCGGASGGADALRLAAEKPHIEAMAVLVRAGVADTRGALLASARSGREAAVKLLLQRQGRNAAAEAAYVNTPDSTGALPVLNAIDCIHCSPRTVRLLVDAGAGSRASLAVNESGGPMIFNESPLDTANRCLRTKKVDGEDATKEQLHGLEGIRRLLLRVAAVHAESWLWNHDVSITGGGLQSLGTVSMSSTPLRMMVPGLRRRARRKRVVLLRALFRWVVIWKGRCACFWPPACGFDPCISISTRCSLLPRFAVRFQPPIA